MNKNETRTKEMVDILRHLQKCVPIQKDGQPLATVLWGDGLSCLTVTDAQESRANTTAIVDKLTCFEAAPQEWHKRLLYVSVRTDYSDIIKKCCYLHISLLVIKMYFLNRTPWHSSLMQGAADLLELWLTSEINMVIME